MSKLVAFGDTHEKHEALEIPNSNYLYFSGDYQKGHLPYEDARLVGRQFFRWMGKLPNRYKIVQVGNHDDWFFYQPEEFINEAALHGISVLTSPVQGVLTLEIGKLVFCGSHEFYQHKWRQIVINPVLPDPANYDILLTHCPPCGIFDFEPRKVENCGSARLRQYVEECGKPKLHLFGHIHEQYGKIGRFCNVSLCDSSNNLKNKPMVLDVAGFERK